ncbi:glycoside hydrolase family 3 protein [Alteriqipengyuania lutimaris]|uniref:Glycoside hydrolase family 3 protein n=2 Tax=Alteriqipengyuania lutimaris TaxID=1538146 RepID=A0A395LJP2_9SPHN|nr:glycoside hydrolase family 3 protein [Alteriqipengyuania lutimaris]MBB3033842.1 beta-glucosidase [Alteriqipengyuania lutimaris]RDS77188.1 glycoside hydrolase family 3 protein [Alteriqipengyuania lutimaris]
MRVGIFAAIGALLATGCTPAQIGTTAPAITPQAAPETDEDVRVADLLSRMSLERKVAQLIQPQINSFTPEDMARYRFGSYLNGGNGGPYGDEFAPASEWLRYADEMYRASIRPLPGDEPVIPTIWGTDAVHGHTNVPGATIFPHNIGLGATRDADLVRRIGAATAAEIEVTGIDWNFSPTVAVARDDRWGRTYESYSENPRIVAEMGAALVEGLQGKPGTDDYLGAGRVAATAKHFFADGGTDQGVDQGDVNGDIEALKAIHAVPYPAAIDAGVEVIMASFNSINGVKMHGNRALLTGVLREEMGFEGVVVGDWNAHGQIAGCSVDDCPQALLAGLDIYMVPDDWKGLLENLVAQVEDGTIPMAKLDEAVGRVLRLKLRLGLLEEGAPLPSQRANAGDDALLGSSEHRALAREAVAKSQVILKNDGVLPLKEGAKIVVAGSAADDIATAAGGWTLTWQGGGELDNSYFPNATSIAAAIADEARAQGGSATYAPDGETAGGDYDAAVVVFGEEPYAEFVGDRKTLVLEDSEGLDLIRKFNAAGTPVVAVFLSGRPMWMNRELNAADAFVAAWLPGSEGAGVSDILFGRRDATGRLSFSWPAECGGAPVNGPEGALFPVGYGRALSDTAPLGPLSEDCGYLTQGSAATWYDMGRLASDISAYAGETRLPNLIGEGEGIVARGLDRTRQEDAREIAFAPGARLTLSQGDGGSGDYRILYNLEAQPTGKVSLTLGETTIDITRNLALSAGKGWREMIITQDCMPDLGDTLSITSEAAMTLGIARIVRQNMPEGAQCSF